MTSVKNSNSINMGIMSPNDYKNISLQQLRKLASGDNIQPPDALAQNELGLRFEYGQGVIKDENEATRWYHLAAEQGYARAQNNLGLSFANGQGVLKDEIEAIKWFRLAADQGYARAQYNLGEVYCNGIGIEKDEQESIRWFRLSAEQGNALAQVILGSMYMMGQGVDTNEKEAVRWYRLAADQEFEFGQYLLGCSYEYGQGVIKDDKEAIRLYRLAANQGNADALSRIEEIYTDNFGITENDKENLYLFFHVAKNGDAEYQAILGNKYVNGNEVRKDYNEAVRWYRLAAEQGEVGGQIGLGVMYANGWGVIKDDKEAFRWYQLAADQGDAKAQCNIGWYYANGVVVIKDDVESVRWLLRAAEQGNAIAQSILGRKYADGVGVIKDMVEAIRWYQLAAMQGNSVAQNSLGVAYAKGVGVIKDDKEAIRWFHLAAEQGNTDALNNIEITQINQMELNPITMFLHDEFASFVGLDSVRDELFRQASYVQVQNLRQQNGLSAHVSPSSHLVFQGNPGTGKTSIARIIATLYHRLGILKTDKVIETDRAGLVAGYIGQTAMKTREIVKSALGGVLFIDEAYTLARGGNNDFGQEAIDTLLKMMEDHRNELVVIVAGYESEMNAFINSNPGLSSRFNRYFHFPNYTPDELLTILTQLFERHSYTLNETIHKDLRIIFSREIKSLGHRFSNARYVRNLFERVVEVQAHRLISSGSTFNADLKTILLSDIEQALGERLSSSNSSSDNYDVAIQRLNSLIGLDGVKKQVRRLTDFVRMQHARSAAGLKVADGFSQHLVFSGNPGTGKTTVARIIADIYFALGVLPSNRIVEVDRSGLVAGYIGQSAIKTREVIEQSIGGVLFIDEAYTLSSGGAHQQDFGREVIDTLLKAMEDLRGQFIVIVAGYSDEMTKFIDSNPGLRSRFNRYITFDDYQPESLFAIFSELCRTGEYELNSDAQKFLFRSLSETFYDGKTSGNGRLIRNLFEHCVEVQSQRVSSLSEVMTKDLITLTLADVTRAIKEIIVVR